MKSADSQCRPSTAQVVMSLQAILLASSLMVSPPVFAAGPEDAHQTHAVPISGPVAGSNWAEALKGQTRVEDAIEGRAGRSEKVELQHHRLMRQMEQQASSQWTS